MVKQGGSQLSQLKSALNSAGLSRTSDPKSKKRKRGPGGEPNGVEAKEKKAARLQQITTKLNPFERKVTKLKMDVPGEKVKGVTGRPGARRQMGLDQVSSASLGFAASNMLTSPMPTEEENTARGVQAKGPDWRGRRSTSWGEQSQHDT